MVDNNTANCVQLKNIVRKYGDFIALKGVNLEIKEKEFFSLLGPSGSGKTTTLRIISGLENADEGKLIVDGIDVTNSAPQERDVAMVFQSYALYPHMKVWENIAFPLKMEKIDKQKIQEMVLVAAKKVKIEMLLDRKPGQLSGGQQQRVALARAIVRNPRLFLLDEPLSNLDAKLRLSTRTELKRLQQDLNITAIYVTHDQEEAMTLSDRIAIFMEGRIQQIGTPMEIFLKPANTSVAAFIGSPAMSLISGKIYNQQLFHENIQINYNGKLPYGVRDVVIGVRPSFVTIDKSGSGLRVFVQATEVLGESMILTLRLEDSLVKMRHNTIEEFPLDSQLSIVFNPENIHLFDANKKQRLN